ncbi:hypothetical protein ACG7TL_008865 [Trametes sanguinea]
MRQERSYASAPAQVRQCADAHAKVRKVVRERTSASALRRVVCERTSADMRQCADAHAKVMFLLVWELGDRVATVGHDDDARARAHEQPVVGWDGERARHARVTGQGHREALPLPGDLALRRIVDVPHVRLDDDGGRAHGPAPREREVAAVQGLADAYCDRTEQAVSDPLEQREYWPADRAPGQGGLAAVVDHDAPIVVLDAQRPTGRQAQLVPHAAERALQAGEKIGRRHPTMGGRGRDCWDALTLRALRAPRAHHPCTVLSADVDGRPHNDGAVDEQLRLDGLADVHGVVTHEDHHFAMRQLRLSEHLNEPGGINDQLSGKTSREVVRVGHDAVLDARLEALELCAYRALGLDLDEEVDGVLGVHIVPHRRLEDCRDVEFDSLVTAAPPADDGALLDARVSDCRRVHVVCGGGDTAVERVPHLADDALELGLEAIADPPAAIVPPHGDEGHRVRSGEEVVDPALMFGQERQVRPPLDPVEELVMSGGKAIGRGSAAEPEPEPEPEREREREPACLRYGEAVAARAPRMNADLSSVRSRKVWRKCAGARRQARGSCRKSAAPAQDEAAPSQAGPAPKTTASKAKGKKAAAATSGNAKSLQKGKAVARATQDAETEEREEEEEEEEEEDVEVDPEEGGNTGTQKGKKKAVSRAKTVAGDEEATTTQKTSRTRQKTARDSEERAVKREPTDVKLGFDVKGMQEHEQSRSALAQRAAKMRLGYGTLNLIDSTPVKLHFGKWNNRPIEPLRVKEIVKQLLFKGLWDWESPIPVVVPRRFIKLDALQAHRPEGTRAPPIVFTDEARDQIIELAGGHHRQQALIEYRATLDKSRATLTSKIAQLSKRKASDETDEALATLRKRLAEVEGTLAQPMLWLTEVFAAEDVDNEMGQYLSMNDEMPNLKQTELERFWLSLSAIKDYNAKYLSTSGKKVVRAPIGTDAWEDHILSKVLAPQDQKRGFGALLKMPRAWDFVNLAGQLAHMRDGKHLKIDTLKKRLCPVTKGQSVTKTVTDSRTKQPVSVRPPDTAGGIWLDLLESVVEEMVFVAKSGDWPESTMPRLQNYVKYLGYSPKQRATTVAANVKRSYEDLYATFMKRGVVDDEVWHADLVKKIDEIYVQTVKPAMASLLRTSTPDWKAAMTTYWAQVDAAVAESWESMVPHCAWGPDTAATVKGAKERLMWVRRLRELGQGYDLPLATLTFIQDLYDHFASVSYGLQWISRQIDPMVDATVTSKYPWVWDHTSNMREFMINPHAVSNPNDQPRHFYLWLCEQMELVRGVDMMLASGIMKPEYEAVFSAPTNTFTNATTVIEDVLLNVVDHDEEPDEIVDDLKAIWNELYENIVPQSSLPKEDDLDMGLYHPRHRAFASPFNVSNKHRQAYPCLSLLLSSAVDFRGVIHRSNRKRFLGTLASRLHFTARIYKEIMEKTLVEPLAATLRNNLLQYLEKNRQRSISSMLKDMYVSAGIVKDGDKEIGAKLMWDVSLLRNVVPPQKQKTKLTVVDRDNFNKSVAKDARMKAYANDIKKIVKMVVGSTAAAAMPSGQGSKGVINGAVAEKLDELVEALSFNASRLEFRREGENTRKVYVMRDKDAVSFKVPSVEKRGDTRAYPSLDHFKSAEPKQWDLFVQLRKRHVERLREKHTQSQASGSGKTSKIVVPRLDDIYPQDVRWPEVDQRIEDMESDVDPDELNFLSEGEGEGDAMDVDKGADESDTDDSGADDSGADDDAQDNNAQDDNAQDDNAQDDDAQDDDAQDDDAQDDDAQDGDAQDDEAHDGKAQDDEAHDGKAQDGGDTQGDQSGQASGAPGSGDLDPNAMPVDPTVSQSDVSMDVPMDGPNVPLTQIPPRPELSPEAERDAHAALVEAAAQGWDEDPGIALEDAFGTLDQLVAIREANQDLALPPPSRASLLKAIASYPELVEGRLDVLHFRPPPISEADFESYRAKLQARIAALPQDAPPSRKVEEVVRLVDSMVPRPAPEAEPTQPVAADPRKRSGRILEHARERHAAAEEQRKRRQTEQPGPSQRKSKKPRRDHRDRREDEMDSDFEGSQTRNDGLAFLSQEQDDFFFNAFDEDEAEAEEIALGEDGEGSDERALGEAAYDEEEDGVVPHGARVSEHVAPTMFTDDGMDQQEVTRSVEDAYGDQTRVAQMYETMPVRNIRLSTLREWYQGIEDTLAMHTLKQKNKIIIDKEFLVNTHDLNVSWTCAGTFLDYRQIVGRRAEMDVLLPNPHAPGAEADHRWNLTIAFEKRHWHFRGDLTALGCDMAGRMLHVGYTMAQEDIWLGLIPKEVYMNPPHVGDVKLEKKSTTMSPALSRAVIAGFLHVMERSGYRDVVLVQKYPDISCDAKFSWTFDIGERKRFEFNLTQMKRLAAAFREGWEEYYEAAPNHYRFKELEDSYPVFITLRYGQNRRLAFDDSLEAAAQTWDREVNYARVWRMSLALATHFKVRQWKEIPVDEILRAHPTVYDSYNPSSRRRIDDLDALPLLDDDGREIHIYSEDGFRVPRREPEAPRRGDRCAIMQNLPEVSSLFLGPASYDLEPDFDGELDEGRAHNIDEAQFDAEPERQDRHYRDTSYTVYPHFYSKTIGQWQATGVMHPLIPYVRQLCRRLTAPGAAGRAVVPLSSQCYNTSAHAMRVSKRFHVVQKGMLTGAATGPWATNARGKATASRLAGKVAAAFPHERITAQLRGDGGKKNSLRLENKFMLDLNHLREEYRNGDAIYRHFVLEHARMCERPPIIDALRRTSILFKYACFPEVYAWATLPVTALIEAVWNHHIKPTLDANNQPQAVRGTVSRKPQPQYVELIACLERVLNYAYTGAAQALPRQLMYGIWAGRSLLQTGFPMLWIGLSFTGESGAIPAVRVNLWPLDQETKRPLTASKCAQEITYGVPHYLGYETLFYMQSELSRMPADLWRDASLLGRQLRLLARIAIRCFVDDTVDLVHNQVMAEVKPLLTERGSDEYPHARARHEALRSWEATEHPLDIGDHGSTLRLLTMAVCAKSTDAQLGLPKSTRGQWSVKDFVAHLVTVASSSSMVSIRPPVSRKGRFWPVLRVAYAEGVAVAQRSLGHRASELLAVAEVKAAFEHVVQEERVRMVPDAARTGGAQNRPSIEPSIHAWTMLGAQARRPDGARGARLTAREREEQEIFEVALRTWEDDPASEWMTTEVCIEEYHRFFGRNALPTNWCYEASVSDSKDAFVRECYEWARDQFKHKLDDWRCDLALHLAFLISKILPNVGWPTDKASSDLEDRLDELHQNDMRGAIEAVRTLPWVPKNAKGAKDESIYYTQASIVFLCWIHSGSPLRQKLRRGTGLGEAWSKKHGNKCLTPVNLIRMGIAYPMSAGIIGRPLYGSNFSALDESAMQAWWKEVRALLEKSPYSLCRLIFGAQITSLLVDRGHFSKTAPPSASTGAVSRTASSSSERTLVGSSKRSLDDLSDEDDGFGVAPPPPRRRRHF